MRDLQVVLGHNHLETTMLYLHTEAGRVASPLREYRQPDQTAATDNASRRSVRTTADASLLGQAHKSVALDSA